MSKTLFKILKRPSTDGEEVKLLSLKWEYFGLKEVDHE